jgi:hypothetical protein
MDSIWNPQLLFYETQTFRYAKYMKIAGALAFVFGISFAAYLFTTGHRMTDSDIVTLVFTFIGPAAILLTAYAKLITEARIDGLYVRFFPFQMKFYRIPLEEMVSFKVREYRPIREYGGYGIKYSFRYGTAYNVTGNIGVQFTFRKRRDFLLGTQRPDELMEAINRILENNPSMMVRRTVDDKLWDE